MSFTIVSERQGNTSRDARDTPQEALLHASALVRSGVEKIWVYDEYGRFISATALSQIAQQRIGPETTAPPVTEPTVDLLASDTPESLAIQERAAAAAADPTTQDAKLTARTGPRVFRIAPQPS